ncbi:GDSL esterase/lipase At1g71691-like [Phragmites australis]|uniref:GDSL esterase/lipase At1g71691-like n=1 Tax=Phragmites australis TaxID=29695 RepID=UPI002D7829C1|nr:GDSL esterase/lipase At1g71691-like [Phragmites australis]
MAAAAILLLLFAFGGATAQVFPPWNGTFPIGPGFGSVGSGPGAAAAGTTGVPAMFVFGDSLTDNGNNNDLTSLAKANYLPYGIDFAGGPTGRFSNGYTMVDEIAQLLGLPLLPANSEASGDAALHGVNYASAAAGILDNTGQNFVGRIPFNQQIKNFEQTLDQTKRKLGSSLARSIFYVGMGSNDYLNNYLMPNYNTRNEYNGDQYSTLLVQHYTKQLNSLYNLGARKFVIAGVGSMACIPNMRARSPRSVCSPDVDDLIVPFNNKVKAMVSSLNANRPRAKFIYVDNYAMISEVLRNPGSYGFSVVDRGCCGIGRNRGMITCLPFQRPCPNRNTYIFWDAFHPTERVNVLLARAAFNGGTDVAFPMNIQQLAAWQP